MNINFFRHTAFVSLLSLAPIALGCSSSSAQGDNQQPQSEEAALTVVGGSGEGARRAFTKDEIAGVVSNNEASFRVDGVDTKDFAKILTAQKVEIDVGGRTVTLLRNGNRLELQGDTSGIAVEIDGNRFAVVSPAGRWDCQLSGFDEATATKMSGAMALGVLLALDPELAAQAEEGKCEIACAMVIAFTIVVSVGILAATTAYIVCETTGQTRCETLATRQCKNGVKSVSKVCDLFGAFDGLFKNGKMEFQGSCKISCK